MGRCEHNERRSDVAITSNSTQLFSFQYSFKYLDGEDLISCAKSEMMVGGRPRFEATVIIILLQGKCQFDRRVL